MEILYSSTELGGLLTYVGWTSRTESSRLCYWEYYCDYGICDDVSREMAEVLVS